MMQAIEQHDGTRRCQSALTDARLDTERLTLRPARRDDVDSIMAGLSHFDVARMMEGASLPLLQQDALELFEAMPHNGDGGWSFAITLKDDQAIGLISLAERNDAYLLQYWLNHAYWGQGLMGDALQLLLHAFFNDRPCATLNADVYADDVPALNLQQRLGFKTIGCREIFAPIRSAMVLKIEMQLTKDSFLARVHLRQ